MIRANKTVLGKIERLIEENAERIELCKQHIARPFPIIYWKRALMIARERKVQLHQLRARIERKLEKARRDPCLELIKEFLNAAP